MDSQSNVIRFPVERCRKSNTQLQEDAIAAFEEALRAYHEAHGLIPPAPPLELEYVTPEEL